MPGETVLGQPAQMTRRRFPRGNDFLGIFVAQGIERKSTTARDVDRLGQPLRGIETLERRQGTKMTLAVGKQRMTGARQTIAALRGTAAAGGDQRREPAVALAIGGEQQETRAVLETELAADNQRQLAFLRLHMCTHDAGERTLVGDRERRVAQFVRS